MRRFNLPPDWVELPAFVHSLNSLENVLRSHGFDIDEDSIEVHLLERDRLRWLRLVNADLTTLPPTSKLFVRQLHQGELSIDGSFGRELVAAEDRSTGDELLLGGISTFVGDQRELATPSASPSPSPSTFSFGTTFATAPASASSDRLSSDLSLPPTPPESRRGSADLSYDPPSASGRASVDARSSGPNRSDSGNVFTLPLSLSLSSSLSLSLSLSSSLSHSRTMSNIRSSYRAHPTDLVSSTAQPPLPSLSRQRSMLNVHQDAARIAGHVSFANGRSGTPAAVAGWSSGW